MTALLKYFKKNVLFTKNIKSQRNVVKEHRKSLNYIMLTVIYIRIYKESILLLHDYRSLERWHQIWEYARSISLKIVKIPSLTLNL